MTPRAIRVLVTRPATEAQRWTQALREHGIQAESLPLIEIAPLADGSALREAWQDAARHAAFMFVSANAVQHFMAMRPAGWALQAQAWGTGPGTHAALLAAGWPQERIRCPAAEAGRFDSEALWALVRHDVQAWAGRSVLIVRGADAQGQLAGRDWLAQRLQIAGVQVSQCVAYLRRAPVLDPVQQLLARSALQDGSWWLFSSSEAAQNLMRLCPGAVGPASRALATHPRIAERLRQQGWGRVEVVPATLQAQAASIECLA
jgi:uroporphyrinogen-III synthase